jgi:hypothetical protein
MAKAKNETNSNGAAPKTDLAKREMGTALSTDMLDEIYAGLTVAQSQTIVPGGNPLLKLDKASGEWNVGLNNEPCQEGSIWMIDPRSLEHGYICWDSDTATKLGEVMTPMYDRNRPKPALPAPIQGHPYKEQRAFAAVCMNGDHEGLTALYRASSVGAIKGVDPLVTAIRVQINKAKEAGVKSNDDLYVYPLVQLGSSDYKHSNPAYGRIWNPIFTVVGWANHQGKERPVAASPVDVPHVPKPQPEAAPVQRKAPSRTRKPAAA